MHELGIVFHIIRTVEDVAKQNDVTRIRRVTLQLGEVSGVVESYLQDCWKWAAAKTDLLPGAVLTVETIPAVTQCQACGRQYETVRYGRTCPHCQSPDTYLVQGSEMMIKEIEAVEEDNAATRIRAEAPGIHAGAFVLLYFVLDLLEQVRQRKAARGGPYCDCGYKKKRC